MKKTYAITVLSNQHFPSFMMDIITNHNRGASCIDLDILEAYILADKAAYPLTRKNVVPIHHTDTGLIEVVEMGDGGKPTLLYSIEERIVHELAEVPEDNNTE